ncbi:DUF1702 family protein [Coleofasciculus sp. F4-SAH-05]|uniref:DUF1702 family protein n=1 Tax=Coleofasciculus sp. F4-SAH-05 TaxID=3069525 RepID=UPI0032F35BA1
MKIDYLGSINSKDGIVRTQGYFMLQTLTKPRTNRIPSLNSLRQSLFSISPAEATFARRGFQCNEAQTQQRLEQVGHTFLQGYHGAIAYDCSTPLIAQLNTVSPEWRGFAFEGAAMGLALLDGLIPWKGNRVSTFLGNAGANHTYSASRWSSSKA